MTWNIGANSIFENPGPGGPEGQGDTRPARFRRVMQKLAPDVVCFQEMHAPRTPADAAALLDDVLPLGRNESWSAHGEGDTVIVSRYPLSLQNGSSEALSGERSPDFDTILRVMAALWLRLRAEAAHG